jgi:hypothetical protein
VPVLDLNESCQLGCFHADNFYHVVSNNTLRSDVIQGGTARADRIVIYMQQRPSQLVNDTLRHVHYPSSAG